MFYLSQLREYAAIIGMVILVLCCITVSFLAIAMIKEDRRETRESREKIMKMMEHYPLVNSPIEQDE